MDSLLENFSILITNNVWIAPILALLGGIFSSPCSTPILIALLALVAGQDSFLWGLLLLLLYSIGHGVFSTLCSTFVGFIKNLSSNKKYTTISNVLKFLMGLLICLIRFYMFIWLFKTKL